ncbi:transposable element Tcb2 transposase [Trichonephila clavipes]|nr:transposable element Tcb2 transposase [Trichonephila clavipes]
MDDNTRPHRADIVDDYLESEGRMKRMAWPAYSPDLNPIENLWGALGRAVSSRFPPLATLIELETALQKEWRLLNSAVVDHLIESMVRRYWQKVVFSDESRFVLGTDDSRVRVWRCPGERYNSSHTVLRHTARRVGVMVWGFIAYDSQSTLIVMRGTLTGQRYVDDILRPHVGPFLNGLQGAIFQQDNARPHTARVAQDFLRNFQTLLWPARSPDLSTVEHVCQVIYSQFGLAIHQNDHQTRRRLVEWAQNEIAVVPDFHKRILFSDEAHFWLNGYVNKQNCRIWSEANPQVYVETPLHPEKLTVWWALWAGGVLLQKR